ncbi:MAG: HAD family hydrolase [Myxococcota bacterium]
MIDTASQIDTPVLLLDVMGTLVHDPFYEIVPAFFGMSFEQLLREKHPTAWIEFELGEIAEEEFLPRFFRDGRTYSYAGLKEAMRRGYAWLPGMEDLVARLARAAVPMHALSNYTPWYRMIEDRTGLSRFVPWSFVSCETGVRKPDPEAYLHAARTLSVPPSVCLFIDDRERNCEAAAGVGMSTILFENAATLEHELKQRSIMPA